MRIDCLEVVMYRLLLFGLATLLLAGCSDDPSDDPTAPVAASVTGTWVGSSDGINMTVSLVQSGTDVTGTSTMNSVAASVNLVAEGTFIDRTLTISLTSPELEPATYSGSLSGSTLTGTINGSGFANFPMTLSRQ
jgi:hypothetical protein